MDEFWFDEGAYFEVDQHDVENSISAENPYCGSPLCGICKWRREEAILR